MGGESPQPSRAVASFVTKRVCRGKVTDKTKGASCPPPGAAGAWAVLGGSRRFLDHPGESSGVSPRDWEKNRRPYWRESSEPHQGDIQGALPLITFASFLERKGCPPRHEGPPPTCQWGGHRAGGQCPLPNGAMGNLVARRGGVANKTKSAICRPQVRVLLSTRSALLSIAT